MDNLIKGTGIYHEITVDHEYNNHILRASRSKS